LTEGLNSDKILKFGMAVVMFGFGLCFIFVENYVWALFYFGVAGFFLMEGRRSG